MTISTHLFDELTCVYKREYLLTRLYQECRRAWRYRLPVSFLIIGVDNMGSWNRSARDGEGDSLLQEIASALLANVRETDLVGRFGDDEFCIILPETTLQPALVAAERVRHTVETEFFNWAKALPVTVSVGVAAVTEQENMDPDIIISEAKVALRLAKEHGRNRVGVSPETILARNP